MNREEEMKQAAKVWCGDDDKALSGFVFGVKWADGVPINPWHNLRINNRDLPEHPKGYLISREVLAYIEPSEPTDYINYYLIAVYDYERNSWAEIIRTIHNTYTLNSINMNVIAWKELPKFIK